MGEEDKSFYELAKSTYGDRIDNLSEEGLEKLRSLYEDKFDTFGDENLALTAAVGSFNFDEHGDGVGTSVDIIGIGVNGPRPWGDGEAVIFSALALPEDSPAGLMTVLVRDNNADQPLDTLVEDFFDEPFHPLVANVSFSEAALSGAYSGEAGRQSPVFEDRESERTREERKELVDQKVDLAKITDIGDYISLTNDGGYSANYGVDQKRLENAVVLDARVSANGARYVVQDDSFIEADELGQDVRGEDNELGLVVWAEPQVAAFDVDSIVNFYGTVNVGQGGQVTMRAFGADPEHAVDMEIPEDDSSNTSNSASSNSGGSGSTTSEPVEERTI